MAVYRDKEGRIVSDDDSEDRRASSAKSRRGSSAGRRWHVDDGGERSTQPLPTRPLRPAAKAEPAPAPAPADSKDPDRFDPAVAWLVITEGAGIGRSFALHEGRNRVGSGANDDVRLDFGDAEIRQGHAVVVYDGRNHEFYLQEARHTETGADSITLGEPEKLAGRRSIRLGQTELQFVPLCGAEFHWDDA